MQSSAQILDRMDLRVFVRRCFVQSGTGLSRIGQQYFPVSCHLLVRAFRSGYRRRQHL